MARNYCAHCGQPLPRRAVACVACETPVEAVPETLQANRVKPLSLKLAIAGVAVCCLGFVVTMGTTAMFQQGGLLQGGLCLGGIILCVKRVQKLENAQDSGDGEVSSR